MMRIARITVRQRIMLMKTVMNEDVEDDFEDSQKGAFQWDPNRHGEHYDTFSYVRINIFKFRII